MGGLNKWLLALCLLAPTEALAGAARGELLYSTHCNACHASEIHWREQKLATGWDSLRIQIQRWQASMGLNWSEAEISDVARYLNALHYGFPDADRLLRDEKQFEY